MTLALLIVIPEWEYLEPAFRDELTAYARGGGSLLLVSWRAARPFAAELDVRLEGEVTQTGRYLEHGGWLGGINTYLQRIQPGPSARPLGRLHHHDDPRTPFDVAATITPVGRGRIGVLWFDYGDAYLNRRVPVARDFLQALVRELFPAPLVEVSGSHFVDVSVARNHGRLLVNLVNTAGPHEFEKQYVFDEIPPVGPLTVSLRLARAPAAVVMQPEGRRLEVTWQDGRAQVTVPRLEIHAALVVEPAAD
jgi:hypothetical protein